MNKNQKRLSTIAMLMAVAPLHAATVSEIEPNNSFQSPQHIMVTDKVMDVQGAIGTVGSGTATSDVDYYSFYAKAGDVVTLDIDKGWGGLQRIDTIIAVFDGAGKILRMNDDASPIDPGSVSYLDSRIDNFVIPTSGIYHVGVSTYPRFFINGGDVYQGNSSNGDYALLITGVSPAIQQISIDVKPGSSDVAPINPKSKGKIPVALLSDGNFNAMDIDTATVTFGSTGNEASLFKCNSSGEDVNGDGRLDLLCHFENQAANFNYESLEGIARGKTRSGTAFEGRSVLKVVPTLTK